MAITQNIYTGDGSTVLFSFTFPYLETTDVKVSLNGVDTTAYTFANATTIQFNTAPVNGAAIRIYRQTDDAALAATFYPGSAIRSQDLNDNFTQTLYVSQETARNVAQAVAGQIPDGTITTSKLVNGAVTDAKVTSLGSPKVTFTQAGTGAVQRTVESKLQDVVSVKDFGAVGDGVTDDTAAIQAAINAAMQVGKPVSIPGPGPYLITSTLQVKITRDALPVDTTPASDIHFSDITSAWIMGDGMPTLKAGSVMASMLELIFDTTDLDLGPFYSRIEGIGFDGNNLATTGIKSNFSMHVSILKNRIWNLSKGIEYTGYGVARIEGNVIRAANGIYFLAGGGDSLIQGNDFYAAGNNSNCIYLGYYTGNLSISSNTFTDEAAYTASCAIRLVGSTAPAFEEIRDVVIDKNEFCGFASAVRADGKSSAIKNIYRITLTKNHTLPFGGVGTGVLLEAVDCKEILVEGNFLNALSLAAASGKGVACVRCEHTKLVNNYFANYSISALELTNCTDSDIQSNKFVDCAKTGSSYVVVVLYGSSSARNYFRHNIFNQTSGTYGQYGILEDAGVDYTYSFDNIFTGMSYPHTKTGSNSVMRRTEYASAVPSTGSYYVGDIVWNTNPAAGGTPGWVCTTSGVISFVFKAMANLAL